MNSQHLRLKWHFEKLGKYEPRTPGTLCDVNFKDLFSCFLDLPICISLQNGLKHINII